MIKANELRDQNSSLNKADADEPVFVIRAKDPIGAATIRLWAVMAVGIHEPEKIESARTLAGAMDQWRAPTPVRVDSTPEIPKTPSAMQNVRARYPKAYVDWVKSDDIFVGTYARVIAFPTMLQKPLLVLSTGATAADAWAAADAYVSGRADTGKSLDAFAFPKTPSAKP